MHADDFRSLGKTAARECFMKCFSSARINNQKGSIELIVIGLLAALIIVLAIPVLQDIGGKTQDNLQEVSHKL